MKSILSGVITAVVTPMKSDGSVDFKVWKSLLRAQVKAGVRGIVVCGTTGEAPTLKQEEQNALLESALEILDSEISKKKIAVLMGTGSNDTDKAIKLTQSAVKMGAQGALVVTPYYNKPTQAGLLEYFTRVADATGSSKTEIMLYNVPGRTGVTLAPKTIAQLAKHPKITSLKEAAGSLTALSEIQSALRQTGNSIEIFCGDDPIYLPMLAQGVCGVVSVASNLIPKILVDLTERFNRGDIQGAQKLHLKYYPLFRDLFIEANPGPIKAAMNAKNLCTSRVRSPLAPMTPENLSVLIKTLKGCGL